MRTAILTLGLAFFAVGCASGGLPRKGWSHHRVGSVEFYSGDRERHTRQLIDAFAKFRVVTGAITTAASVEPRLPAQVFLFPDQRSYQKYTARENSGGVFTLRDGEFTIALNANSEDGQELLFHEYTHLIVANTGNRYPDWYNEGFAEVMATMRFVGSEVHVGRVSPSNLRAVAEYNRWVPLDELLGGEVFSSRDDRDRLHRHYAQAWLTVHYIQFGNPDYTAKVDDYIALAAATSDPRGAFEPSFGVSPVAVEKELRDYIREQKISFRVMPAEQFEFPAVDESPDILTPASTAGALARMCWKFENLARAQTLRAAALAAGEPDPIPELG